MEELLPYYERELSFLRRYSQDFAERYPKIAARLALSGEHCEDPHVERMIESFALLGARINKKLDDDYRSSPKRCWKCCIRTTCGRSRRARSRSSRRPRPASRPNRS
jgi:hypothetical protein